MITSSISMEDFFSYANKYNGGTNGCEYNSTNRHERKNERTQIKINIARS